MVVVFVAGVDAVIVVVVSVPGNDLQSMTRAHRLSERRSVTTSAARVATAAAAAAAAGATTSVPVTMLLLAFVVPSASFTFALLLVLPMFVNSCGPSICRRSFVVVVVVGTT